MGTALPGKLTHKNPAVYEWLEKVDGPVPPDADDIAMSITWTEEKSRSRRRANEASFMKHLTVLRGVVSRTPPRAEVARHRKSAQKLAFMELFVERDPRSFCGRERLMRDRLATADFLFFLAGALFMSDKKADDGQAGLGVSCSL